VREAIEWENKAEYQNTPPGVAHDRTHIHSRLLSRAFALEPWAPVAAEVERLREAPRLVMTSPGLWVDATQQTASAVSFQLSLSFVNTTARSIEWDAHTLYARATPEGEYELMFSCSRNGSNGPIYTVNRATVAPGGRVNVVCYLANSGHALGAFDAAWLELLRHGDRQWFLQGPPSNGGTYDYRDTLASFASERSHAAAAPYLRTLTCNQNLGCLEAKVAWLQSPLYLWLRDGGPALLAGIALTWLLGFGQRARMARVANMLVIAIVVLYVAAVAFLILKDFGMGGVGLALAGGRMAVGAIVGVLAMKVWAGRAKPG
jgi:hypothetical protein